MVLCWGVGFGDCLRGRKEFIFENGEGFSPNHSTQTSD
jgi:hypothetical protein